MGLFVRADVVGKSGGGTAPRRVFPALGNPARPATAVASTNADDPASRSGAMRVRVPQHAQVAAIAAAKAAVAAWRRAGVTRARNARPRRARTAAWESAPRRRRPPARRLEPDAQLVAPARRVAAVVPQPRVDLEVGPQRVPAAQRAARAVVARVLVELGLQAAEQPIPDDEDAAVVAIEVDIVRPRGARDGSMARRTSGRTSRGGRSGACAPRTGTAGRSAPRPRTPAAARRPRPSAGRTASPASQPEPVWRSAVDRLYSSLW